MADIFHSSETCTTYKCRGSWSRTENHDYFGHGPVYEGSQATKATIEGKHMKRAFKAHALTVEVLYDLLFEECEMSKLQEIIKSNIGFLSESANNVDYEMAKEAHREVTSATINSGFKEDFLQDAVFTSV